MPLVPRARSLNLLLSGAALLAAASCSRHAAPSAGAKAQAAGESAADSNLAQVPYTIDEIRKATKVGRTYEFLVRGPGQPEQHRVMTFLRVADSEVDVQGVTLDARGAVLEPPKVTKISWEELRHHGEFPKKSTTIRDETISIPAGRFTCEHYTVDESTPTDSIVDHFFFPTNLPGLPVLFYTEKNGKRLATSTLFKYFNG